MRDRHEQSCLRYAEAPRLLSEIGERRSADAFEIAAVGGELEVKREDLTLAERPFQSRGIRNLLEFREDRMRRRAAEEACHLHGQRRSARNGFAVRNGLHDGPPKRQRIDAGMPPEATVFEGEQQREISGAHVFGASIEPPTAFGRGEGPQQVPVAVENEP